MTCVEALTVRVYRVGKADGVGDAFLRRTLELADGRSVEELAERLYQDELQAGAWVVDIGFWKDLYIQEAVGAINKLAGQGHLRLERAQ